MVEVWLIFNFLLSSLAVNVGTILFYWKMTVPCRGLFKVMSKIDDQSGPTEVFLGKGLLKTYSKFTGEHPSRKVFQ